MQFRRLWSSRCCIHGRRKLYTLLATAVHGLSQPLADHQFQQSIQPSLNSCTKPHMRYQALVRTGMVQAGHAGHVPAFIRTNLCKSLGICLRKEGSSTNNPHPRSLRAAASASHLARLKAGGCDCTAALHLHLLPAATLRLSVHCEKTATCLEFVPSKHEDDPRGEVADSFEA